MDVAVTVPREMLRIVFDAAVNSLDFGSGFLDDEDVEALRDIAIRLGADPDDATPFNFDDKYLTSLRASELNRLKTWEAIVNDTGGTEGQRKYHTENPDFYPGEIRRFRARHEANGGRVRPDR